MTLDDILASLFGDAHDVALDGDSLSGRGTLPQGGVVHVLGFAHRAELGVDQAIALAGRVLDIARTDDGLPILFLIDSSSQRMSRRDELMGLSEYLAHLAKALLFAEQAGHRSVGLLYGGSAAGAFIASALACGVLVALPGAHPEVMDLPSMSRVTKLPLAVLQEKAKTTPVFAPGMENLVLAGAIAEVWDPARPLSGQLEALLAQPTAGDPRGALGKARGGRTKALDIAERVVALATAHG
ncbi:biotin-independent malonate decarboxylase subunit gamma [Caulobacter sp. S45]|jgi:malonate decarboxylase gamma subunit|uniref:biotin-independent malonate decarboxylase subunit gamma n=1 Tax=Caulobacter sp. S45 TaxID=1641861 RepID=UPI00131A6BA1|nr:biotin-independent malonate decarboxylase subunit gamma [Caulobacter sp. S45]